MIVYRISPCTFNRDLSGMGAALYGGRWNSKGIYIVYTSMTPSLAMLESVVHLSGIPKNDYCMATINIPDDSILELRNSELPAGWNQYLAPDALKVIGDRFISHNKYLALRIPSAIVAMESNILINPNHPDFKKVRLISSEKILIDKRLVE
ncbi:MAG: RES family NAD+ phosphorylase [Saprospiraceae bacterium]